MKRCTANKVTMPVTVAAWSKACVVAVKVSVVGSIKSDNEDWYPE